MRKLYLYKIVILLYSLAVSSNIFSQEAPYEIGVKLQWKSSVELYPGHSLLFFEGAVNYDSFGFLPVFQYLVPGNLQLDESNIKLVEEVYESLEIDDISNFPDIELVENQPGIILTTFYTRKIPHQSLFLLPIRKAAGSNGFEKLISFKIQIDSKPGQGTLPVRETAFRSYAEHSVLRTGDWYKIGVSETGIYKITYADLEGMGIDAASTDPRKISLYGNGSGMLEESNAIARPDDLLENAIYVHGEEDGVFDQEDYILFYGESPVVMKYNPFYLQYEHEVNFYTDETCYFLTVAGSDGKRVVQGETVTGDVTTELYTFQDLAYHEKDSLNLIKSGLIWYGEIFNFQTDYNFQFDLSGIDLTQPLYLKANLAARSTIKTVFNIYTEGDFLTDLDVPSVQLGSQTLFAKPIISNYELFYADDELVDIRISFEKPGSIDIAWLNYIQLNYVRHLSFTGGQLDFRDMRYIGPDKITRYHIQTSNQGLSVWEVTDPLSITIPALTTEAGGVSFKAPANKQREFIAFDGMQFYSPRFVEKVENQDLHGFSSADYIIISHPLFLDQAHRIADHHRQYDGMTSQIVTPAQIYNEFSSGVQDVSAIRDFMKMLYDRAAEGEEPRHLLLFGDASYDFKNILQVDNNLVPAYQSRESIKYSASFVTDDYFGCLDNDEGSGGSGTLDIGVGRFPVTTVEQAEAMVTKSINYMLPIRENFGPWRNNISFIGDDKDNNTHLNQAEGLSDITDSLGTVYNINKIYLDAYPQFKTGSGIRYPDVNEAINQDVSEGCLIMNYTGHGGEVAWADERVLDIPAIQSYRNINQLPVFVTATCEFTRYDDPSLVSAGELVFLNTEGAGVGLFTTTRQSYSTSNYAYNKRFYYEAFKVDSLTGEYPRLGDLIIAAKTPSSTNIKNFVLLGDPALMLAYPKMRVRTLSIKTEAEGRITDTIHALSKVIVEGQVENLYGDLLDGFNGLVYTSVYDKPVLYKTRGNEPQSKVTDFYIQDKKIFKGEATVSGGKFSFEFIVPVDISYQFGEGKISYYAFDTLNLIDANGYDEVWIGGSESQGAMDTEGPEIDLFLNSRSFVSGDITTPSPLLIADLFDDSGINTVGNGIGHDIVAIIDGNFQEPVILNDYFTPETDSYQKGTLQYRIGPFENGLHTLTLKAWDVMNNSSEKTIEFQVNVGARLSVSNLQCRPNPYRESTSFYFEHNKPGSELEVMINIYSLMGQHMTTLYYTIQNESTDSGLLTWNGLDDSGNELSAGLYVYTLMVKSDDGYISTLSQKLLHFR
jgi:hypothetical protein